jgi:hypothetical protein
MKMINGIEIVTLDIDGPTWGIIQSGLNELPRKISEPVMQALTRQVLAQSQPISDPPPAAPDAP